MRSSAGCQEAHVAISHAAWEGQLSANPGDMRTRRRRALPEKRVRISRSWRCAARSDLPANAKQHPALLSAGWADQSNACQVAMHPKPQKHCPAECYIATFGFASYAGYCGLAECIAENDPKKHARACTHTYVPYLTSPDMACFMSLCSEVGFTSPHPGVAVLHTWPQMLGDKRAMLGLIITRRVAAKSNKGSVTASPASRPARNVTCARTSGL